MYSVFEWISYENDQSIECKSQWIRDMRFGGAMIFSLNADDFNLYCLAATKVGESGRGVGKEFGEKNIGNNRDDFKFPLTRKVRSILNP